MTPLVYIKVQEQLFQRIWNETMDELSFSGVHSILECVARA